MTAFLTDFGWPGGGLWLAALLGAVLGSFLNVVIHRLPRGMSLLHPRSHCPGCTRPVRPWENIPILSYIALGGRCRGCGQRIPLPFPSCGPDDTEDPLSCDAYAPCL